MKKRLQCLLLALVLLATVFVTACGEEEIDKTLEFNTGDSTTHAMTITLWGIKGENTTDEAILLVEEAMSAITKADYKTNIKLNLYTEDEYIEALEARMKVVAELKELKEAEENKVTLDMLLGLVVEEEEEETVYEDETIINEIGIPEIVYPEVAEDQLDIFYIPDYDTYLKYVESEQLAMLNTEIDTTGKKLKTYIHPNVLNATMLDGMNYAVINNKPVGEYTYLLLNKALMDKYYYDSDTITTFDMAEEFIMDIGANEPGIVPVLGEFDALGAQYFTPDGKPSVVGNVLSTTSYKSANAYGVPRIIFQANSYVDHLRQLKRYESFGYIGDGTADVGEFAVGVVTGSVADVAKYADEYDVKVLQKPYVDGAIYNDMFAISEYTNDLPRAMQILTAINTDTELRNIFGYGIEGVHYKRDVDGVVVKINNDYDTELRFTGNMFIAYPPEGSYPTVWEDCKAQNLELKDAPYFGFVYEDIVSEESIKAIADISARYFAELENVTYAQFDAWIAKTVEELKANETVTEYISFTNIEGLAYAYNEWFFGLFPDAME